MGSNNNKPYGAPDFERYYSGQMSAQEMHALEKAALEDPFLADALEGYKATRTPSADLAWLREQLATKSQQKKVVPLTPKKSFPFLRIAALVLLLLGAGWGVFYLMDSRKDTLALEQREEKASTGQKAPAPVVTPDTLPQQTMSVQAESAPATETPTATPKRRQSGKRADRTDEAPAVAATAPVKEEKNADAAPPMLLREQEARDVAAVERKQAVPQALEGRAAGVQLNKAGDTPPSQDTRIRIRGTSTLNTFRGRVVDANNQGVANATVSIRNRKNAVATDEKGYFTLSVSDTAVTASVAAVGFESKNITLNRGKEENNIILSPNAQSLSEVVVVGYGVKKKQNVTGSVSSTMQPQPAEGWQHFEEYVQKNRKGAGELSPQGLKGSVTLSFEVSRKGRPSDIKVDSSLSPSYDEEAVRLLRQGPKWKRVKDSRGKVTIPFQ